MFSSPFDLNALSLRLMPFLCMFAALLVWMKAFRQEFSGDGEALLALLSFAFSYHLIYYSAELKQYSMDVLAAGVLSLSLRRDKGISLLLLPLFLFFSYAALLFFWIPAFNLFVSLRREKGRAGLFLGYSFISLAVLTLVYLFDLRFNFTQRCLFGYWRDYFICTDSLYCFSKSFTEGLRNMVAWPFGDSKVFMKLGSVFIPFFLAGFFICAKRLFKEFSSGFRSIDAIAALLFMELFIAGILKKYPFTGERITLFFMPFVFIMIIKGISLLRRYRPAYILFSAAYSVFLVFCGVNSLFKYLKPYF